MSNFKYLGSMISLVLIASSCAGLVDKTDKEALQKVRSVAIVGFTFDQQEANSGKTLTDNLLGANDMGPMGKINVDVTESKIANYAYELAALTFQSKLGFKVLPQAKTAANAEVAKFYAAKDATFQTGVDPLMKQTYRYEAKGIPQAYYVHFASKEKLNALAKSLGVDAIVLVRSKTRIAQSSVMGIGVGSISSVNDVSALVYDPRTSDFIVVANVSGDPISTKAARFMGFADAEEMNVQAAESYNSALMKLIAKF